jgi:hypothetical protein
MLTAHCASECPVYSLNHQMEWNLHLGGYKGFNLVGTDTYNTKITIVQQKTEIYSGSITNLLTVDTT